MKALRILSRIIVGLVFIFSGFVKAVDPLGLTYKLTEYLIVYKMPFFIPMAFYLSIFLISLEFVIGVGLVSGVRKKIFNWLSLLMMAFFTVLTLLSAIYNPVSDCGCFGDAIHLTNWQTFYKNIILIVLVLIYFFESKIAKYTYNSFIDFLIIIIGLSIVLGVCIYSYRHLPIIDFLPWKVGNKISEQVIPSPEVAKINLVYKNKATGEIKEYPSDNYPWQDTVWLANWQFVDQKKQIITPFKDAPIHDFTITDEYGMNLTEDYIGNKNYQFILVSHDLKKANRKAFEKIKSVSAALEKDSISFIGLSGSTFADIDSFRHDLQIMFPFFTTDETALKTMIRSNPGLLLLKNGVVIEKWHYNDFPNYDELKRKYIKK